MLFFFNEVHIDMPAGCAWCIGTIKKINVFYNLYYETGYQEGSDYPGSRKAV